MATIAFGAIGTLVAGPIGGAIGALAGRQIDRQIIGSPTREGPRLQELKASTSSYGQPIAIHAGRVRSAGTIVWSSNLVEESETSGGGKGNPKTRNYSYSISLAVVLASHPIDSVGRIWADGNLLRGTAGDLKTGGEFRLHTGHADQQRDPLLASVLGAQCPAFRGCAYAVLESLDLTDFGNRVPALTFEVIAAPSVSIFQRIASPCAFAVDSELAIPGLEGFTVDGGGCDAALALLDKAAPLSIGQSETPPRILRADRLPAAPRSLSPPIAWPEAELGAATGSRRARGTTTVSNSSLRYYDIDRDYQSSVQHAARQAGVGDTRALDFPASLRADAARRIVQDLSNRVRTRHASLLYRVCAIDPAIQPGAIVRAPGHQGLWSVQSWEWREGGVELELERILTRSSASTVAADPGLGWVPPDRLPGETHLRIFELPWDGTGSPDDRQIYAALGASEGRWAGASLYAEREGSLVPLGMDVRDQERRVPGAVTGTTESALTPSSGVLFESRAHLDIHLDDALMELSSTTRNGVASGDNRLLVGEEILQFQTAEPLGANTWRLTGLLRGRGGTEPVASVGQVAGARVALLDDRLVPLGGIAAVNGTTQLAALDNGGADPVLASLENPGRTLAPPCPVHPHVKRLPDGALALRWTRRARGAWTWASQVDVPLVEQTEFYEVGAGDVARPGFLIGTSEPRVILEGSSLAALPASSPIWVRQVGTHAKSTALLLTRT